VPTSAWSCSPENPPGTMPILGLHLDKGESRLVSGVKSHGRVSMAPRCFCCRQCVWAFNRVGRRAQVQGATGGRQHRSRARAKKTLARSGNRPSQCSEPAPMAVPRRRAGRHIEVVGQLLERNSGRQRAPYGGGEKG
jgi:hypothetical protein